MFISGLGSTFSLLSSFPLWVYCRELAFKLLEHFEALAFTHSRMVTGQSFLTSSFPDGGVIVAVVETVHAGDTHI